MSLFFGLKIFHLCIVITTYTFVESSETGFRTLPSCEQIKSMRSELNKIFSDAELHTSALRLGK